MNKDQQLETARKIIESFQAFISEEYIEKFNMYSDKEDINLKVKSLAIKEASSIWLKENAIGKNPRSPFEKHEYGRYKNDTTKTNDPRTQEVIDHFTKFLIKEFPSEKIAFIINSVRENALHYFRDEADNKDKEHNAARERLQILRESLNETVTIK